MSERNAHSVEAELSIVSAVLVHGDVAIDRCDGLRPEHFFVESNRRIFEAAVEVLAKAQPCDVVSVATELRATGRLQQIGGSPYLAELVSSLPDRLESLGDYARIVREQAALRALVLRCASIAAGATGDTGDVAEYLDRSRAQIEGVGLELSDGFEADHANVRFVDVFTRMSRAMDDKTARNFVSTGIRDLDVDMSGFESGYVSVLGAPTNWGKSGFVVMVADEAINAGKRPLIVTYEDHPDLYIRRLAGRRGQLNAWRLKNNALQDHEYARFVATAQSLSSSHRDTIVFDARGKPIELVVKRIARMCDRAPYDLIVFDYLQAAKSSGQHESKRARIDHCLREITDVIKTHNAAGLIVSQFRRTEAGAEPTLADLKESGDIEISAEVVLLGFSDRQGVSKLRLAKNKDGPKLTDYELGWDMDTASVRGGSRIEKGRR